MKTADFTLTFLTESSPQRVFQSIIKVKEWWAGYYAEEIEGNTEKLND